ncbi:hypothetical protein SASPL_156146 [Salvia splendens]|uniref:Myb/SANT-like domain-containing protein n=1 Tax=Salvia splendens TaxID=180675 RepID=A0A8X8YXJ9_SALSN|nr:hypothetical protein SASPL_156146 [Salvia splendens]
MAAFQRYKASVDPAPASGGVATGRLKLKQPKIDRTRHMWSDREEQVLLTSLMELVVHGWKSDNGFRSGYLKKLEDDLRREFHTTDLKANHKIDCDDEMWRQIVKNDPNARFIRGKSWPYYDAWKEIFGKDRANGEGAEDILEAVNNICAQPNLGGFGCKQ